MSRVGECKSFSWPSLDLTAKQKENGVRITCAVGAALVAVGMAVAIYYCCTTTTTIRWSGGGCGGGPLVPIEPFEKSNAILSVLPGAIGGVIISYLVALAASDSWLKGCFSNPKPKNINQNDHVSGKDL